MTISKVISKLNMFKPNSLDEESIIDLINELESEIVTNVLELEFVRVDDKEQELSVPEAYETIYFDFVAAKIDFYNGDVDFYALTAQQFNSKMKDLKGYCIKTGLTPGFKGKRVDYY